MALICAIWGAATIPDNCGKSFVKVEEFYEDKAEISGKIDHSWREMYIPIL